MWLDSLAGRNSVTVDSKVNSILPIIQEPNRARQIQTRNYYRGNNYSPTGEFSRKRNKNALYESFDTDILRKEQAITQLRGDIHHLRLIEQNQHKLEDAVQK